MFLEGEEKEGGKKKSREREAEFGMRREDNRDRKGSLKKDGDRKLESLRSAWITAWLCG